MSHTGSIVMVNRTLLDRYLPQINGLYAFFFCMPHHKHRWSSLPLLRNTEGEQEQLTHSVLYDDDVLVQILLIEK